MGLFQWTKAKGGVDSMQLAVRSTARYGLRLFAVGSRSGAGPYATVIRRSRGDQRKQISGYCSGEIERSENLLQKMGGSGPSVKENESPATATARS
ncbi:hypothetical protein TIFTF001_036631 [Ficus carica]|uniref:Uncharacterized protein n=1 Tax=Ficus carica TaxID=3494 RepID=A0AA88E4N8_FICCA|nr:hypothetical protein TIFTF001_036631 [Ficus carica]